MGKGLSKIQIEHHFEGKALSGNQHHVVMKMTRHKCTRYFHHPPKQNGAVLHGPLPHRDLSR